MATLELPARKDLPAYKYNVVLDGSTFVLEYTFNTRMSKWFLSISDQTGTKIIDPVPIVANWPLFQRFKLAALPKGILYAFDTSGADEDPGRFELGDRVRMFYQEAG